MKWTQSVLSCAGVLACLVIALTGCGKTPAGGASGDATDINDSTSASADVTEATAESETTTASVSTDGTAGGDSLTTTTTTTTTTKTAPTQETGTKPTAAQVGNANFKPGTLYKGPTLNFRKSGDAVTLGVWWWNLQGIVQPVDGVNVDTMLDMLIANRVTEIYLDVSKMMPWDEEEAQGGLTEDDAAAGLVSERHVRGFVKKCNKYGIRVAALTGASAIRFCAGLIRPKTTIPSGILRKRSALIRQTPKRMSGSTPFTWTWNRIRWERNGQITVRNIPNGPVK